MNTSHTARPYVPRPDLADTRIPFPHTEARLACRTSPSLFALEDVAGEERRDALQQAERACSRCPIAADCLKWALANPELTPSGVWAATSPRKRTTLRQGLERRLGPDWVGVVAEQDRRRREKEQAARLAPPTVRERAPARGEQQRPLALPSSRKPPGEPITPVRQARNLAVRTAALSTKAA